MSNADLVVANQGLFKLDWVRDPRILERRGKEHGLSDRLTLETSAWCAEIHAQIEELAREAGLVLKAMTLLPPPIGVEERREDALPRQLYDLDDLAQRVVEAEEWEALLKFAGVRHAAECALHRVSPTASGPWDGILERLSEWRRCDDRDGVYWSRVQSFQTAQIARATKKQPEEWRARVQRLRFFVRCLTSGSTGLKAWNRGLQLESRLAPAEGSRLREQRGALGRIVGIPARQVTPRPRSTYWEFLGEAEDLSDALDALDGGLPMND